MRKRTPVRHMFFFLRLKFLFEPIDTRSKPNLYLYFADEYRKGKSNKKNPFRIMRLGRIFFYENLKENKMVLRERKK